MRRISLSLVLLAACGAPAAPVATPKSSFAELNKLPEAHATHHLNDPDLNHGAPAKLIDVDWERVQIHDDAEALALWKKIAPTGDDWERKVDEIPSEKPAAHQLALALLREGNFACAAAPKKTHNCSSLAPDVPEPAPTATLADPCLRRLLAMWAIDQLEPGDLPAMTPTLHAIASLPPPESQLVAAAFHAIPEADQDARYAIFEVALKAGQHEVVDTQIGTLDEAHVIAAASKLHLASALDILSAEGHTSVYVNAILDDKLASAARAQAIVDISAAQPQLRPDAKTAITTAATGPDCLVAARAARVLDDRGDHRYLPRRPAHATKPEQILHGLCVLVSYEQLQSAGETSLWQSYLPAKGVERVTVTYDPLSETDTDGDGDPHTMRTLDIEKRADATLPEIDDLARAMASCSIDKSGGNDAITCTSDQRVFRFVLKTESGELVVKQVEVAERPPCQDT